MSGRLPEDPGIEIDHDDSLLTPSELVDLDHTPLIYTPLVHAPLVGTTRSDSVVKIAIHGKQSGATTATSGVAVLA